MCVCLCTCCIYGMLKYNIIHILSLYLIVCRYHVSNCISTYIYVYVHIDATTLHTVLYFVYDPAEQLVQVVLPSTRANCPRGHSGQ